MQEKIRVYEISGSEYTLEFLVEMCRLVFQTLLFFQN